MKALVVYDTFFGNTEEIARAVAAELGAEAIKVDGAGPNSLAGLDLLVVGSPTRGFSASPNTKAFLKGLAPGSLQGVKVAAFDTRITIEDSKSWLLNIMMKLFGWAAPRIAKRLTRSGGTSAAAPEGFAVLDSKGPLKPGEVERAKAWARRLAAS